jgi:hypothetical protein
VGGFTAHHELKRKFVGKVAPYPRPFASYLIEY